MKPVVAVIGSRWFASFIGTALIAGLVWYYGPLLPQLEDLASRLAVVGVLGLLWICGNLVLDLRRRRRDAALTAGVTAGDAAAATEEAEALRDKLTTALQLLKKTRGGRGYLYEQPWYAIIGPPGAGKTTALLNAGLHFPLAEAMGQGAVAGVGGTRLCDWWFTENAVLIDTAGRYTTQDSDEVVDRAGWDAFLDLLKRTRSRQPLNGVIIAIALSDIAQAPADERLAHAHAIRSRIKELERRLRVRIPVYAMFTKADLIAGFSEYFDDLDRETRGQVWGTTFPLTNDPAGPVGWFADEFRALVERLDLRLLARLHAERSADRRALIAMFPTQVASLERPLVSFLEEAFGGTKSDPAPLLRGVYLTSGTQEGTPIDRLTGTLARAFGLDQRRAPSLRPEQGRSYFLGDPLREVVLGEAMLVCERPGAARRRFVLRTVAVSAAALIVVAAGGLLWYVRGAEQRQIDAVETALGGYEQTAQALPLDPVDDDDLARLIPLLDQARALPHGYDDTGHPSPLAVRLGLSQDAKLAAASRALYRHALERALLPRLVWRLEAQMRGNLNRPDFLYEATRVYLMLGDAGPLDRDLVHEWMRLDWEEAYPGPEFEPIRVALLRHLDALLDAPLPQIALDGALVTQARGMFANISLAQRVYSRIRPSAAALRIPPWRPADALGPAGVGLFVRASGKPLTDGIPGFDTVEGFHEVLLPSLKPAVRSIASETWVLGQRTDVDLSGAQMDALEHDVIALYEADYAREWDATLADLNVAEQRSLAQAAQALYILASPQSPMRALLESIARQLSLSIPPVSQAVVQVSDQGQGGAAQPATNDAEARLRALLGAPRSITLAALPPGHEIDERYKALRDLVGSGPGAPIDLVLKSLIDMQQQLAKMAAAAVNGGTPPAPSGPDPAPALRAEAQSQPQPLARWLSAMAESEATLRNGGNSRQQVIAVFNGAGGLGTVCPLAINGRYPFTPDTPSDISLEDFSRLFGSGGLFDGFVNTLLHPYIDMASKVWRPMSVDGAAAPVSIADLSQFQRAATIRDTFFAAGGKVPSLRLDIMPISIDAGARQVTLDFDGATIAFPRGKARPTQITWPGAKQMQNVSLTFDPPPADGPGVLQDTGPWAMFRLFARGELRQAGAADHYTLTFQQGERQAAFDIHTGSTLNPFDAGLLRDFRCPAVQ